MSTNQATTLEATVVSIDPRRTLEAMDAVNCLTKYFKETNLDNTSRAFINGVLHNIHSLVYDVTAPTSDDLSNEPKP